MTPRKKRPVRAEDKRRRVYSLHVMLDEDELRVLERARQRERSTYRAVMLRALLEWAERNGIARP